MKHALRLPLCTLLVFTSGCFNGFSTAVQSSNKGPSTGSLLQAENTTTDLGPTSRTAPAIAPDVEVPHPAPVIAVPQPPPEVFTPVATVPQELTVNKQPGSAQAYASFLSNFPQAANVHPKPADCMIANPKPHLCFSCRLDGGEVKTVVFDVSERTPVFTSQVYKGVTSELQRDSGANAELDCRKLIVNYLGFRDVYLTPRDLELLAAQNEATNACHTGKYMSGPDRGKPISQDFTACNCLQPHQAINIRGSEWYDRVCRGIDEDGGGDDDDGLTLANRCSRSPAGYSWLDETQSCVAPCPENSYRLSDGTCHENRADCPAGTSWTRDASGNLVCK